MGGGWGPQPANFHPPVIDCVCCLDGRKIMENFVADICHSLFFYQHVSVDSQQRIP